MFVKKLGYFVYEAFQLKTILFHKTKAWEIEFSN